LFDKELIDKPFVAKKVNAWRVAVSLQTKFMSRNLFIKIRVPSIG